MPARPIERVCILGVGLLGGSIARALRAADPAVRVTGWGRSAEKLAAAVDAGIIDHAASDIAAAAGGADLVVAATPVQQIVAALDAAAASASPDSLLLDVGSTKGEIAAAADRRPWAGRFCPSHPIAGSEKSGAQHATATLLRGKAVVLTPTDRTAAETVQRAEEFWESLGARTLQMTPAAHDRALARTSHLPHFLAAALAGSTPADLLPLVGSGWCDTTRVAAGDPGLWRQIAEENRIDTLSAMRKFATIWAAWVDAMDAGDFDALEQLLAQGKQLRDAVGNRHSPGP